MTPVLEQRIGDAGQHGHAGIHELLHNTERGQRKANKRETTLTKLSFWQGGKDSLKNPSGSQGDGSLTKGA